MTNLLTRPYPPYCTLDDVQRLISTVVVDDTTLPTDDQVTLIMSDVASVIDTALASAGYVVPVAVPPGEADVGVVAAITAFAWSCRFHNAKGTAHKILCQAIPAFPEAVQAHGQAMGDAFSAWLLELEENSGIPIGLPKYADVTAPRGYLTDIGAWGQPNWTVDDQVGKPIKSEPMVSIGMTF
jgi:hypothetical protein